MDDGHDANRQTAAQILNTVEPFGPDEDLNPSELICVNVFVHVDSDEDTECSRGL